MDYQVAKENEAVDDGAVVVWADEYDCPYKCVFHSPNSVDDEPWMRRTAASLLASKSAVFPRDDIVRSEPLWDTTAKLPTGGSSAGKGRRYPVTHSQSQ